jgi:hypothetical protein
VVFFLGAISRFRLYLLFFFKKQKDTASIGAKNIVQRNKNPTKTKNNSRILSE